MSLCGKQAMNPQRGTQFTLNATHTQAITSCFFGVAHTQPHILIILWTQSTHYCLHQATRHWITASSAILAFRCRSSSRCSRRCSFIQAVIGRGYYTEYHILQKKQYSHRFHLRVSFFQLQPGSIHFFLFSCDSRSRSHSRWSFSFSSSRG